MKQSEPIENSYKVNVGRIFSYLTNVDQCKWKNYDRAFLRDIVQYAMQGTLVEANIALVQYDGKNGEYLKHYEHERYPNDVDHADSPERFPFPDYFLRPDQDNRHYMCLVSFMCNCIVEKDSYDFDLLFALQFTLTEIIEGIKSPAKEFLQFHLDYSFENNISEYIEFLENLCLKYKFIKDEYKIVLDRFIKQNTDNKIPENKMLRPKTEKLKWLGNPSQFGYIFSELAAKGFIELPSTNSNGSYAKYTNICWELFEFKNPTTLKNLEKEMNPNKNTLSETVRAKFSFPDENEIGNKKKKQKK